MFVLSFQDLQNEASHAISGTPDSRTSLARIVNGAVEYLVQFHPWSWRTAITTLGLTAAQAYVDLPPDFGRMIDLQPLSTGTGGLRKATPRGVVAARSNAGFVGGGFVWFLGQAPQADPSTPPLKRLELGPTPAATVADAFTLVYRRLLPVLVNPSDVPAIPYGFFELLKVLVRAMAVSSTTQQAGHDWELFRSMVGDYTAADGLGDGENDGALPSMVDGLGIDAERNLRPGNDILMPGDW